MKNNKKAYSFVLILALLFSSFSFSYAENAPAYLVDVFGNTNQQAITICNNLGIVTGNPDGTFLPDNAVTRAEFAAMITRTLAIPESVLSGFRTSKFQDTSGYSWAIPYLSFCESKGILLGDGSGNVMPGKTININEAITMALRAIGYTANSSALVGSWPGNYISVAQDLGLYEEVNADELLNRGNAAKIIYNLLPVGKVTVSTDGTTTAMSNVTGTPSSCLNTGLNCTVEQGIIDMTTYSDSLIQLVPYMGAYADIYKNEDGQVIAVKTLSETITGFFSATKSQFELPDQSKSFQFSSATFTTPSTVLISNGHSPVTLTTVSAFAGAFATVNVEMSGSQITQFYSLSMWLPDDTFLAEEDVQDEIVDDKTLGGYELPLTDDGEVDYSKICVFGAPSIAQIAEDNVVSVYLDPTTDEVFYVEIGTAKFTGKITEAETKTYYSQYTVNGAPVLNYSFMPALTVGTTYDFKLDAFGYIYEADAISGIANKYGIIKAHAAAGINDEQVKLFTSNNEVVTFDISDDVTVVSNAGVTIGSIGTLMGYELNNSGDIDTIDLQTITCSAATLASISVLNTNVSNYVVEKDCSVFSLDASSGDYRITTIDKIKTGVSLIVGGSAQIILDDSGHVTAMIINDIAYGRSDDDIYAVFDKVTDAIDEDENEVQHLIGFANGESLDAYTDDSNVISGFTNTTIGAYQIEVDSDGLIISVTGLTPDVLPSTK